MQHQYAAYATAEVDRPTTGDRWLAGALVALALALAANAVAGPLVADAISYPFSETLVNQTVGLEAVTLLVVAPWSAVAAWFVLRGHRAGPVLALPPAGYAAYMFVQYVLGPQYLTYRPVVLAHLAIVVLSGAVVARAWSRVRVEALPTLSPTRRRRFAAVLALLAAFLVSRYLGALSGMVAGDPLPAEYAADPTMYWSIVLLDLGVVLPVTVATCVGLLRDARWAKVALYAVVGWFTLVPVSVAAMGLAMLARDDPNAAAGDVAVLAVVAVLFTLVAAWVYRPLFRVRSPAPRD